MKNLVIVILGIFFAATAVTSTVLYRQKSSIEKAARAVEEEASTVSGQKTLLQEEVSSLERKNRELSNSLKDLKEANEKRETQIQDNMKRQLAKAALYQKEINDLQSHIAEKRDLISELEKTKNIIQSKYETCSDNLESSRKEILSLKSDMSALSESKELLEKDLQAKVSELIKLHGELQDCLSQNRSQNESYNIKIGALNSDIAERNETISDLEDKINSLDSELNNIAERNRNLETLNQSIQENHQASIDDLEASRQEMSSLRAEMSTLAERKEVLEQSLNAKVSELEHVQGELQECLSQKSFQNESYNIKIGTLKSDIADKIQTISALEDKIDALDSERNNIAERNRKLETLNQTIQEKHQASIDELEASRQEISSLRADIEASVKSKTFMEEALKAKDAEIAGIRKDLKESRRQQTAFSEKIRELEARLEHARKARQEEADIQQKLSELTREFRVMLAQMEAEVEQKGVTIERLRNELSVTVVDRILFDSGSARLRPEGEDVLLRVVGVLKEARQKSIRVVGHTDNVPIGLDLRDKYPTNWELSAARAASVVRFLHRFLDPDKMEAVGCSFYDPVAENETPEGRAKNRRVEIMIAPRLEGLSPSSR